MRPSLPLVSPLLLAVIATGCSAPGGPYPSLQPRAAEAIDPRVPVERPMNDRPVSADLAGRLAVLVAAAQSGDAAFDPVAAQAEQLASAAAEPHSESWTVAQEALSAAVAARKPVATALADIDAIGATALQTQGGIAPNDLSAIQRAAGETRAIDEREAARITAIQQRLGS